MKKVVYKRILLTHDGSKLASSAIPHALSLATACHAEILLLQIIESLAQGLTYVSPDGMLLPAPGAIEDALDIVEEDRMRVKGHLNEVKAQLEKDGLKNVTIQMREGDVGASIIDVAQKEQCDLIVMSTHGRSGINRMLLGSVADYVIKHAPCPVLLVHPKPVSG